MRLVTRPSTRSTLVVAGVAAGLLWLGGAAAAIDPPAGVGLVDLGTGQASAATRR